MLTRPSRIAEYWAGIDAEDEADPWHDGGLVEAEAEAAGW